MMKKKMLMLRDEHNQLDELQKKKKDRITSEDIRDDLGIRENAL